MKLIYGIFCIILWAALPARAQAFTPPEGCKGDMTVQYAACQVVHIWSCERDAPGVRWIGLFDHDGKVFMRKVDREFQLLEAFFYRPASTQILKSGTVDPPSVSRLLATGEDHYDFTLITRQEETRYVGHDTLTGERAVIDGVNLRRVRFEYERFDHEGGVIDARAGLQYVSDDHNLFFWGANWDAEDPEHVRENAPVSFDFPGDEGFMADNPAHGCQIN